MLKLHHDKVHGKGDMTFNCHLYPVEDHPGLREFSPGVSEDPPPSSQLVLESRTGTLSVWMFIAVVSLSLGDQSLES